MISPNMLHRKSGSEKLLSFADGVFPTPSDKVRLSRRHLVKLVGLPDSLPGSAPGSRADVVEETPRVFHCFFLARGVEDGVAAEDLFTLGERAVGDRDLAVGAFVHADASGAKGHALAFDQPPRLHALYYELVHGRHLGLCRQATSWIVRTNADEAHVHSPRLVFCCNSNHDFSCKGLRAGPLPCLHHIVEWANWKSTNRPKNYPVGVRLAKQATGFELAKLLRR